MTRSRAEHAREMVEVAQKHAETNPDGGYLCYFLEDVPSVDLMFGEYPKYLGSEGTNWTEEQTQQYQGRFLAAKIAFEAVREAYPNAQLSLGWTHPQFQIPLMRMGFPAELFDVVGMDFPTFMRMPEMPIRDISPNRLWILKTEMDRLGYGNKPIVHHETYFPSSHPEALGEQTGSDYTVRFGALSLALGSSRLLHCFSLHDCSDYWGSQHYGASGLIGKSPTYRPKAAMPAYAAMTRLLDMIQTDGFVPTDSLSLYAVAFRNLNTHLSHKFVYALWTLRGSRPVQVTFGQDAAVSLVDAQGNERALKLIDHAVTIPLNATPVWLTSDVKALEVTSVGDPIYDSEPSGPTQDLGTLAAGWSYTGDLYERLETNSPVLAPFVAGPMTVEKVPGRGPESALRIALQATPEERPTVDWYGVLEPASPVMIPGSPKALGLWVNGRTSWGRVIYELEDATGERFLSTGDKGSWNGDDSRQDSYFNFDGWRYVEFPLPSSEPYDHYRGFNSVWWGYDQDGVVDLPLKLTKIVVTHRTHHVYVNDLIPIPERRVDLGGLVAVYANTSDMDAEAIAAHRIAPYEPPEPDTTKAANPYIDLNAADELPAPEILGFAKPEAWYDGTQIMVEMKPVDAAQQYNVYVSAYEDGAGAMSMAKGAEPALLVRGLRPEFPLYVFVTYTDQKRQESKPSAIKRLLLKDDFPNKQGGLAIRRV
ncbi:MAG: hypothetical protein HQ523_08015 [Lentisphaerae bacterium]|nr:hypothetical protein [Lentisphaerota bacterium]